MTGRLAVLIAIGLVTIGSAAALIPVEPQAARELRPASRLARDGDLQADWNRRLDARARLEPEWGLAEAWDWLGAAYLRAGEAAKPIPASERGLSAIVSEWVLTIWSTLTAAIQALSRFSN
jgi:hypothetical protein